MEGKQKTSKTYSPEVRARAVRMVQEHQGEHGSQWAAISVETPPRTPLSNSDFFTHSLRDCAVQPIFVAIDDTADQREV